MLSRMDAFLLVHVGLSLLGIFAGFVAAGGMLASARLPAWTALFLVTTVGTSATGFFLPAPHGFGAAHVLGILSLIALAVAIYALCGRKLATGWRPVYVVAALASLYLNVFVLVVQLFRKVPAFLVLAPTQSEPPFAVSQGIVFLVFLVLGIGAVRRFRPLTGATS